MSGRKRAKKAFAEQEEEEGGRAEASRFQPSAT